MTVILPVVTNPSAPGTRSLNVNFYEGWFTVGHHKVVQRGDRDLLLPIPIVTGKTPTSHYGLHPLEDKEESTLALLISMSASRSLSPSAASIRVKFGFAWNFSLRILAHSAWGSTATTRAPISKKASVLFPMFAPTSKHSSPRRKNFEYKRTFCCFRSRSAHF